VEALAYAGDDDVGRKGPPMSEVRDPQIQHLLDRAAIGDCLARYARGLDRHDEELVLSAYFEDAVDRHGQFVGSPRELAAWGAGQHESVWDAHQHFLSNTTIELDGDLAHVETYVMFVQRRRGGAVVDFGGGRYVDRFERRAGEWRIAARVLVMDWVCEAGSEDPRGVLARYVRGRWDREDLSYARPLAVDEPVA
jgi:ketosteroid isomerase-like protein